MAKNVQLFGAASTGILYEDENGLIAGQTAVDLNHPSFSPVTDVINAVNDPVTGLSAVSTKSSTLETTVNDQGTRLTAVESSAADTYTKAEVDASVADDKAYADGLMAAHEDKDYAWMNSIYTSLTAQIVSLQNQIDALVIDVNNKVLDPAQAIDIEASSSAAGGWTVPSGLGGQINGKGGSYLLVGTGLVTINGMTVYDNRGIPLAIEAPPVTQIVAAGDVIVSQDMISLQYVPYVSA